METATQETPTASNGRAKTSASKRKRACDQADEITLVAKTIQAALTSARAFGGDTELTEIGLLRRGANGLHLWRARYSNAD